MTGAAQRINPDTVIITPRRQQVNRLRSRRMKRLESAAPERLSLGTQQTLMGLAAFLAIRPRQ